MTEAKKMNIQLSWEDPASGKQTDEIHPTPLTIGRDVNNQVVIPSVSVSRQHARLEVTDAGIEIKDLNSSNGTFYDGQQVDEVTVKSGSVVTFGKIEVKLDVIEGRPNKPSKDYLFSALIEGEAEPTITLSSLDKKSLFAELDEKGNVRDEILAKGGSNPSAATQKLSGEELRAFLSGRLQKDMDKDIAPDIDNVGKSFKRSSQETAPVNSVMDANDAPTLPRSDTKKSGFAKFMDAIRRLFGG